MIAAGTTDQKNQKQGKKNVKIYDFWITLGPTDQEIWRKKKH